MTKDPALEKLTKDLKLLVPDLSQLNNSYSEGYMDCAADAISLIQRYIDEKEVCDDRAS